MSDTSMTMQEMIDRVRTDVRLGQDYLDGSIEGSGDMRGPSGDTCEVRRRDLSSKSVPPATLSDLDSQPGQMRLALNRLAPPVSTEQREPE